MVTIGSSKPVKNPKGEQNTTTNYSEETIFSKKKSYQDKSTKHRKTTYKDE